MEVERRKEPKPYSHQQTSEIQKEGLALGVNEGKAFMLAVLSWRIHGGMKAMMSSRKSGDLSHCFCDHGHVT